MGTAGVHVQVWIFIIFVLAGAMLCLLLHLIMCIFIMVY